MSPIQGGARRSTKLGDAERGVSDSGANRPPEDLQRGPESIVVDLLETAEAQVAELEGMLGASSVEKAAALRRLAALARTVSRARADASRLEEEAAQMRHFAYHDALTGLPNRSLFLDRLRQALAQRSRRSRKAAVLLLDLNEFKQVNDRFGHAVGDELLGEVARRLLLSVRSEDTIARYGGDEFIILLPDVDGRRGAGYVSRKIQRRLTAPFQIGEHAIEIGASIGIAVYPFDGPRPEALIDVADAAMYRAKQGLHVVTPLR